MNYSIFRIPSLVLMHAAVLQAMARLVLALRPASCVVFVMVLSGALAFAQKTAPAQTDVARPNDEELAIPADENRAGALKPAETAPDNDTREAMCLMIESAAKANDLPLEFFVRVIWQESRFQSNAVGPVTRSGQRAEGIAQFMPRTAIERRLLDPFDPVQALPKSAEFLNELRNQFGNLGLAAAAYNAGPRRVQEWLAGAGPMPQETRNYVAAITGSTVDEWANSGKGGKMPADASTTNCRELMALLKRAPNSFVSQLVHRVTLAAAKLWGVQVAAGFNRDHALVMYARAMKGLSTVIGNQDDPSLQLLLFRSPGTSSFYQVRIGTNTRREAHNLCSRIRKAGGACLVKRNIDMMRRMKRASDKS
jgi:Transglycosylase SLT domain/SPOR domain